MPSPTILERKLEGDHLMNIYEKLLKCRIELQEKNLKKSGVNKFAGYDYYELADFLPFANQLFANNKLCPIITFTAEMATLVLVNTEKLEETLTFTSPMATAELKGCHQIQNLGAVETYSRRYLYITALEITEHDSLDATTGKTTAQKPAQEKPATPTPTTQPKPTTPTPIPVDSPLVCSECGAGITLKVSNYSTQKLGRPLCFTCQKSGTPEPQSEDNFDPEQEEPPGVKGDV
jgi:hypothetical protein